MNMDIDIFYEIMRKSLKENDIDGADRNAKRGA